MAWLRIVPRFASTDGILGVVTMKGSSSLEDRNVGIVGTRNGGQLRGSEQGTNEVAP